MHPKVKQKLLGCIMLKKKQKKHSLSDYLRYMHMIEDGYSFHYVYSHYGSDEKKLKVLWQRYQELGIEGLKKKHSFLPTPRAEEDLARISTSRIIRASDEGPVSSSSNNKSSTTTRADSVVDQRTLLVYIV